MDGDTAHVNEAVLLSHVLQAFYLVLNLHLALRKPSTPVTSTWEMTGIPHHVAMLLARSLSS